MEWYKSEATHEVKEVQTDASPTTVFLRKNIHTETREDDTGSYEVWVYEEAKVTHEEYEQMLTAQINAITPYTVAKQAYIEDTEIIFTDVPTGNLSVYMQDSDGNYPDFTVSRTGNTVQVTFEPLGTVTTVTISVL